MKTVALTLSALTAGFIMAGCGGGSSATSPIQTSKISGTVPGTLIEAFCADGSYYSVKSTDNNTTEHPFEIEIPNTVSCSLVMTTNENNETLKVITQIGVITPNASGTLFTAATDIYLGNIPLAMDPADVDNDGDHVADEIFNIEVNGTSIKVELENPLDDDNDGLVNIYEDDDNDSINNHDDDDDDNDGIPDIEENDDDNDLDNDGITNDKDVDDDNDGLNDDKDDDDDDDGLKDDDDDDDDNDGLNDVDDNDSEENDDNVVL